MVPEEPIRDPDESLALFQAFRTAGDISARDKLVELHMGLVRHLARRFAKQPDNMDDLVQAGSIGLLKAVNGFDPSLGYRFSAYAASTIIGEIKRHIRDKGWSIRPPRRLQELWLEIGHLSADLTQELGRSPTISEIAAAAHVTETDVLEAMEAGRGYRAQPLEPPADDDERPHASLVGELDKDLELSETRLLLEQALERLSGQEQEVLRLRYFSDMTQTEIGATLGISQMQVSRLLARSLLKLRELLSREPSSTA